MKNNKTNQITWLRIAYWTGAIVDFIFAVILVVFPGIIGWLWQLPTPVEGAQVMWAQYFGVIVFAWTCILIWGDRKPLERRGLILFTAIPVLVGLMAVEVGAIFGGIAPLTGLVRLLGLQCILLILFLFSYFNSANVSVNSKTQ